MSLREYKRKRDFQATPEPEGGRKGGSHKSWSFVVQKHDASRLHYDFRLELDGALKSWAVPKGPSLNPGDKRLAVRVEDHPLEYGDFEGTIPKGQYGGGTVMVWDRGTWEPMDGDPQEALIRGKLSFKLHGSKLQGRWTLTRMRSRSHEDGDNWLLIKHKDEYAADDGLAERDDESIKSGRSMEEIAQHVEPMPEIGELDGARKRKMPSEFRPQLCVASEAAPAGDKWLHEVKFDGYRLLAFKQGSAVRLVTRSGKDWTKKFGPIAEAVAKLRVSDAILDGEAVIVEPSGRASFQKLQQAIKLRKFKSLAFYVFDVVYYEGYELTGVSLGRRKQLLEVLVPKNSDGVLRYSDHVIGGGPDVQVRGCELGLEGIVSKRIDSAYTQGRAGSWVKVKCGRRQEFVIVGYSKPSGSRKHFGSLLLGAYDTEGRLVYTGRAGTGFDQQTLKAMFERLKALERSTTAMDVPPRADERRGVMWVEPKLVAEVNFNEWTEDSRLRQPVFEGLREDKPAREVRIESPVIAPAELKRKKPSGSLSASKGSSMTNAIVKGVKVTHPDRVLYPEQGLTKLALAEYYVAVADHILPHVVDRPLSTVRCPKGLAESCFFQKHMGETFGDPVKAIKVKESGGIEHYIGIDSVAGLVALVQFGVLEIHPWGAKAGALEKPDMLCFDLDPGPEVKWSAVVTAAKRVRGILAEVELESYVKTSGGKGLHVNVPLKARADWDEAKEFARAVSARMAREESKLYVGTMSKQKRAGRIYVDYLRNSRGATSVAPYSTRARAGAPVSMPLRWEELDELKAASQFRVANTIERLQKMKRPVWADYFSSRQQLTQARLKQAQQWR